MIRKIISQTIQQTSHRKGDYYFRDLRWRPGSKHFLMQQNSVLFFVATILEVVFPMSLLCFPKTSARPKGFGETHCPIQRLHCLCEQVPYLASTDKYMLPTPLFFAGRFCCLIFRKDIGNTGRVIFSSARTPAEKKGTRW